MKKLVFLLAIMLIAFSWTWAQAGGTDQNQAGTAGQTTGTQAGQGQTGTADQPADQGAQAGTADQNAQPAGHQNNGGRLPQTGSELPLLATLGLSTIGGALALRRKR